MDRSYRRRIGIVTAAILVLCGFFIIRLFSLQLIVDEEDAQESGTYTYTETVNAGRGDILDRHGTVLVSSHATYSVTLQTLALYNSEDPNAYLLSLAETCIQNGIEYEDGLPISYTVPYVYTLDDLTSQQLYLYKKFFIGREWDMDMTAENLVSKLKSAYSISEDYTDYETRLIMGLRYQLDLIAYANAPTYTLTEDIDAEQLALLKELGVPGMGVISQTVRDFETSYAAQLLGHVGYMTEEEYNDTYEALGYDMDAMVGKDGFELGFEEYLHGTPGIRQYTMDADGNTLKEEWLVEPVNGSNVVTTLDIGMQQIAEESLASRIQSMAEGKEEGQNGYDASSGAVVVLDCNNFEILAAANYPTYDPNDYADHYDELLEAEGSPLANRALMYGYAPGSTFKMITSIAALRKGIDPDNYTTDCTGLYLKYDDYTPQCWIHSSGGAHGTLNMKQALAQSCNIYFFTMGDYLSIESIDEVASSLGFGQHTGSEVPDNAGQMADKETKQELYSGIDAEWWAADNLMAAIGQSLWKVTPLQLCRYVATLANGGTQYNCSFLRRVVSSDFQDLVYERDATPTATDVISDAEYAVIKEGMMLCATEGTAEKYFTDYDTCEVACKTGTAQHGNGGSDNAAFVCWAPADDPEIAIAIYVEHGDTGGYYAAIAQDIIDYYYSMKDASQAMGVEETLVAD